MINIHAWLDVPDYEWMYQIRISTNEMKSFKNGRHLSFFWKERILKPDIRSSWHICYSVCNWKRKGIQFHRIVCRIKYWHYAPKWFEVCHNDWNPQNNHPDNLRYDTRSNNAKDMFKHWTANNHWQTNNPNKWKIWKLNFNSKTVLQFTESWIFIREWGALMDVQRELWIRTTNISQCCLWRTKSAWGFCWKYKNI